jgi:pSer/pThr/pTyr-binding forkhead associated (FHA) protein
MSGSLRLEVFQNGELLRTVPFDGQELWLGRDEECMIRLDDRAISRKHALIRSTSNGVEFEKKSKFGSVRLNGKETEHALIQGGERLELGSFEIRFVKEGTTQTKSIPGGQATDPAILTEPAITEPALAGAEELDTGGSVEENPFAPESLEGDGFSPGGPDPFQTPDPEPATSGATRSFDFSDVDQNGATRVFKVASRSMKPILEFGDGTASMGFYEIVDAEIAIGRSQKCHVVLEDKRSSRKHAIIIQKNNKVYLKDLGSANGTLLNGERVGEQELHSGDVIRIGDTQFTFKMVQSDYEQKKVDFFQVPQESESPAMADGFPSSVSQAPIAVMPAPSLGGGFPAYTQELPQSGPEIAEPVAPDFTVPEEETQSFLGRMIQRYRMLNTKQQVIYGLVVLAGMYFIFDEPPPPVNAVDPVSEQKKAQKKAEKKPGGGVTYEMLTKDQKDYVDAQYDLAFEHYKNRDYDKSLFELDKIFKIVQDHKRAREIETYAREAKRRLEAQEEDRKRKELERQSRLKLEELLSRSSSLMEEGKYQEAEELFPEIEILEPENAAVSAWRKKILEESEKRKVEEENRKRLAGVLAKAKVDVEAAEAFFKEKRYVDALEILDEVVERVDLDARFAKRIENRIQDIEKVMASERDPHIESAKRLESEGKLGEAHREYKAAIAIDPSDSEGPAGIKRIQGQLNSMAKAIYSDGVIAEGFGDYDVAEKKYREVIETVPSDNSYHVKAKARLKVFSALRKAQEGGR